MIRRTSETSVFHAISCPTRRTIMDALSEGEQHVNALVARLPVTQSAVSQQLVVLKSAGLVEERRDGRFRYYKLRSKPLLEVQAWMTRYRAHLELQLDALGHVLDAMDDDPLPKQRRRRRRK
jgi:DNA-binding transcriptional ArsR family regulator